VSADLRPYGADIRVSRIAGALEELQNARIEPDLWGIEALDSVQDYEQIIAAARRGGRKQVGCIILGRGEDQLSLRRRLAAAAAVEGFIGFVVGRACFEDPLLAWQHGRIARAEAVGLIAYRYRRCAEIFESRVCAAA
jgi:5-dehydro-2-deoxygluconokinase